MSTDEILMNLAIIQDHRGGAPRPLGPGGGLAHAHTCSRGTERRPGNVEGRHQGQGFDIPLSERRGGARPAHSGARLALGTPRASGGLAVGAGPRHGGTGPLVCARTCCAWSRPSWRSPTGHGRGKAVLGDPGAGCRSAAGVAGSPAHGHPAGGRVVPPGGGAGLAGLLRRLRGAGRGRHAPGGHPTTA